MLENWVNVPTNSILTIHHQTVMVHPILDKYYEGDPYHIRSSAFVQEKGLITNEKTSSGSQSPERLPLSHSSLAVSALILCADRSRQSLPESHDLLLNFKRHDI